MAEIWDNEPDLTGLQHAHALLATDPRQALVELSRLADHGSVMSMMYIANAHRKGIGTRPDPLQAEEWYRRAAARGSVPASYEVGRSCLEIKSYSEAVEVFRAGAAKNYPPSINALGVMYLHGNGVEKDVHRARALFENAMALGHVYGKRNLGVLLMRGASGPLAVLKGGWLFVSGIKDVVVVTLTDRYGDRLR